ncbi:hypothetical protein KC19_2G154400 [Ceratodon purpureus]|uniref:NADH dehydrogenase subunit 1 n=1 Tax=Ceratodon purpureus TaxID=3225 RepID=A0A8T0IU86_CERPU|nr:hypothetical protein KC19_2G154400 [Ceratodon purpureus]
MWIVCGLFVDFLCIVCRLCVDCVWIECVGHIGLKQLSIGRGMDSVEYVD